MSKKKRKPTKSVKPKKEKKPKKRDISIVTDVKEPFSWHRFWDEKIVANWIAFKGYLDKKGVLYLLMSPFRYRARLIARLWLIVFCVLVGVVPRSMSLIQEAKQQYRSNEFVLLENKVFTSGRFTVSPLMSSHFENKHIMTFNISGSSRSGVASTTDRYDVRITPGAGVSKPEEMKYRYQIVPFDSEQRILVVEFDLSGTTNTGGAFNLWINDATNIAMQGAMPLTISSQQVATPLYDGKGVKLANLSSLLSTKSSQTGITRAGEDLAEALETYQIEFDRLKAMGTDVSITPEQLKSFVEQSVIYKDVIDESTTDIVTDAPIATAPVVVPPQASITINGKTFTEADYRKSGADSLDERYQNDMIAVIESIASVTSRIQSLNLAKSTKYSELYNLSRILSSPFDESLYTPAKTVAETQIPTATPAQ